MKTTTKKIDGNSVKNQEIKGKFVQREVKALFSYEMNAILSANIDGHDIKNNLPAWEDVENLYEYKCPDCGEKVTDFDTDYPADDGKQFECEYCDWKCDDAPESEPQDILEWWIVTEWFAKKLHEKGEPILEWGNNHYWGRTCSGQAILLDGVITDICSDMEILEGQANEWK